MIAAKMTCARTITVIGQRRRCILRQPLRRILKSLFAVYALIPFAGNLAQYLDDARLRRCTSTPIKNRNTEGQRLRLFVVQSTQLTSLRGSLVACLAPRANGKPGMGTLCPSNRPTFSEPLSRKHLPVRRPLRSTSVSLTPRHVFVDAELTLDGRRDAGSCSLAVRAAPVAINSTGLWRSRMH